MLICGFVGIPRDCSEYDIKKAYRRESLKHHPDKVRFTVCLSRNHPFRPNVPHLQGGDEEKFKLVVEAHGVLSDPRRRERYDLGEDENETSDPGMGGMGGMDLSELFAHIHGGGFPSGGGFSSGGSRGHAHGFPF
jgi:DnaJ family protein C protein 7